MQVRFGPLIRYPDGSTRQHGAVPREGALIVATGYRHGGGAAGNVGPSTLVSMRTSLPYVDRVENIAAAIGGVDAETVDNAKLRGPQSLRAGARAVTVDDFERLASSADPAIARVRCLPPLETGAPIRLLVVPGDRAPRRAARARRLRPLRRDGRPDHRAPRRASHPRHGDRDRHAVLPGGDGRRPASRPGPAGRSRSCANGPCGVLYRYLNPLTGGPNGTGWPFDADLNSANVFQLLEAVDGVERVEEVLFFEHDLRNHERVGFGKELVKLERDSLFLSANHQVVVR